MVILSSNTPQGKYSLEQSTRFWRKVNKTEDCWLWTGATSPGKYGYVVWNGKRIAAHRLAYELIYGDIPEGLLICHKCNNPSCVNPVHLYAGTPQDNMNDKVAAGHHLNTPKGEKVVTSKLSESQVEEIRKKYRYGKMTLRRITLRSLAKEYGVSYETIRLAISNQTWKQV